MEMKNYYLFSNVLAEELEALKTICSKVFLPYPMLFISLCLERVVLKCSKSCLCLSSVSNFMNQQDSDSMRKMKFLMLVNQPAATEDMSRMHSLVSSFCCLSGSRCAACILTHMYLHVIMILFAKTKFVVGIQAQLKKCLPH